MRQLFRARAEYILAKAKHQPSHIVIKSTQRMGYRDEFTALLNENKDYLGPNEYLFSEMIIKEMMNLRNDYERTRKKSAAHTASVATNETPPALAIGHDPDMCIDEVDKGRVRQG